VSRTCLVFNFATKLEFLVKFQSQKFQVFFQTIIQYKKALLKIYFVEKIELFTFARDSFLITKKLTRIVLKKTLLNKNACNLIVFRLLSNYFTSIFYCLK